jgi:diaminopimelate epimerase
MTYEIIVADPAKNITVFVLNPVADRVKAAKALLAEPSLKAEQVGFVLPPTEDGGLWRLEMMGGEFCGNAARSFGLYIARSLALTGDRTLTISVSGMKEPLETRVNVEEGRAELDIPRPAAWESLDFSGKTLPVCVFEGISQIIALDLSRDRSSYGELFSAVREQFEKKFALPGALGVMFYDTQAAFMTPAVYVYGAGSLVFESSCGSGSAALAAWQTRELRDGEGRLELRQPGGVIEVKVRKAGGEITAISIGGKVGLSGPMYRSA